MGHGASLPQAGEEIKQTPVRSLLQVQLKNLVPEVYSVYYRSGGGLMCMSVRPSVCVSKNQRGTKNRKKKSVEHGDLKIKINSGFQNSEFVLYGPTRVYEVRIRTDHPE